MLFLVVFLPFIVLADKTCVMKPRVAHRGTLLNVPGHKLCKIVRNFNPNGKHEYTYGFDYASVDLEANHRLVCIQGRTSSIVVCYCAYRLCGLHVVPGTFNQYVIQHNQFRNCFETTLKRLDQPGQFKASHGICPTAGACFVADIEPGNLQNIIGSTKFYGCVMTVGTDIGCYEDYVPGLQEYDSRYRKFCICRPTFGTTGCYPDMTSSIYERELKRRIPEQPPGINGIDL